jgi:hypothetical protein
VFSHAWYRINESAFWANRFHALKLAQLFRLLNPDSAEHADKRQGAENRCPRYSFQIAVTAGKCSVELGTFGFKYRQASLAI